MSTSVVTYIDADNPEELPTVEPEFPAHITLGDNLAIYVSGSFPSMAEWFRNAAERFMGAAAEIEIHAARSDADLAASRAEIARLNGGRA